MTLLSLLTYALLSTTLSINATENEPQVKAYFGDKSNNLINVVNIDDMKLIEQVKTNHEVTYSADTVKHYNKRNSLFTITKLYVNNRGSSTIDVLNPLNNEIVKSIELDFYPRSTEQNPETGFIVVSGVNKTMASVIDTKRDKVLLTVGEDTLTTSTGHPQWLNKNHFAILDREHSKILTYKIENSDDGLQAYLLNSLSTPSSVHNIITPEIHGQRGKKRGKYLSTIFYATAEGTESINGSILKLEFLPNRGLEIIDELEIPSSGSSSEDVLDTGTHHHNFLADKKTIYVGTKGGKLYVVDYSNELRIVKSVEAGHDAGHTAEFEAKNIAVVINHTDKFITLMNTEDHTKVADIEVSNISDEEVGIVQSQAHPQYHFSEDGRYFYLFLTEEGELVKVDLEEKKVVERLEIGGHIPMGSFVNSDYLNNYAKMKKYNISRD